MPYIGNTIRAADDYRLIDDISSSFNGSTTSFALQVAGSSPVPFPKSPQQVLISVNGVIQEPDPTGASGFNLVGTNIVFSSAPTNGHAFFGIIYATADYLNAGGNFPSGSLGAPSLTFIGDENTGLYRKSGGSVGFVSDATEIANFDSNGITFSSGNLILGDSSGSTDDRIKLGASGDLAIYHDGSHSRLDETGTGNLMIQSNNAVFIKKGTSENIATFNADGNVELYYDNSKKFETTSIGWKSDDSVKGIFGTGGDAQIFHNGSNFFIKKISAGTGNFYLDSEGSSDLYLRNGDGGTGTNIAIRCYSNAGVDLRHQSNIKLQTTSNGATITGVCTATSFAGDGSSLSGISTDLVTDTSPQLGADLDVNDFNIKNGTAILDITENQRFEFDIAGTEIADINGGGIDISAGNVVLIDNVRAKFGNGDDLEIYSDGSTAFYLGDDQRFRNAASNENFLTFAANGAATMFFDGSKKFETTNTGVTATGDINITDDLVINTSNAEQILRDFTNSSDSDIYGLLSGSTFGTLIQTAPNGHHVIALRENDAADSLAIVSGGGNYQTDTTYDTLVCRFFANGVINIPDNGSYKIGTDNDLQIFHDGSFSRIKETSANALIFQSNEHRMQNEAANETMANFIANGAVELYHDNTKMLSTESRGAILQKADAVTFIVGSTNGGSAQIFLDGDSNGDGGGADYSGIRHRTDGHFEVFADNPGQNAEIHFKTGDATLRSKMDTNGHFIPENDNAINLGSATKRWANVYSADLQLSNEGSSNDVDGTWGSYTIQEGAEDLFLINKRSGKKFKFNLTEVS